jgi:hypothetical protein
LNLGGNFKKKLNHIVKKSRECPLEIGQTKKEIIIFPRNSTKFSSKTPVFHKIRPSFCVFLNEKFKIYEIQNYKFLTAKNFISFDRLARFLTKYPIGEFNLQKYILKFVQIRARTANVGKAENFNFRKFRPWRP